ncbi:hypothetical protein KC317_g16549 [Hortaea werneckii]|nr:hypothetical protein KC317_g16549 [Hortaea werneckii]
MSRALLTRVSTHIHHHVKPHHLVAPPLHPYTTTTTTASLRPHQVLTYRYEPHPRPINCTTLPPTKDFLSDPYHPHHLNAQRKSQTFNPAILNWRVHCPVAASGKKVIRDWCYRRTRTAFQNALQRQLQLNHDGSPRDEGKRRRGDGRASSSPSSFSSSSSAAVVGDEEVSGRVDSPKGLKGALLVILKAETALTASREEVRRAVEWVLESVRREDRRAREMSGGKSGRKGQPRGESRSMKGGGKGSRPSEGGEVRRA